MRKIFIFIYCLLCLISCATDYNETLYEPIYVNTTEFDVEFIWSYTGDYWDTSSVNSLDSAYCKVGDRFPILIKDGLKWSSSDPFTQGYLIFYSDTLKCLNFIGDDFLPKDIRLFSSYENIGECDFCIIRAMTFPEGMLYTITEDLYKLATPCEKENSKK